MRITTALVLSLTVFASLSGQAQTHDVWSLERCVRYALDHNISIQQNVLNERLAKLKLQQSQLAQLPNANASGSYGRSFGRSIDPTSNQFVNADYSYLNAAANADLLVFGWFEKRNTIAANKLALQSAHYDLEQLQNDVSLNVATGFLRALQAQEQIHINENQVTLSKAELEQTQRFAGAGRVPELNVAQLESQMATDSSNLIVAIANYNAALLDLKALLNLDFATDFDILAPATDIMEQIKITDLLDPEQIYVEAYRRFGSIKSSEYKLASAQKSYDAARGSQWPQLGLNLQSGSSYASTYKDLKGYIAGTPEVNGSYISVNGTKYPVYQPSVVPVYKNSPFFKQVGNNFRQTISLSLNIPIFNAWQAQYSIQQAKINVLSQMLNKNQAELTLKQNIYKTYNDAVSSIQKYNAAKRAAIAARRAFDFAQKRYDLGLTNTVEYLSTQNNQYVADANFLSAKYDLIFRLKVIDYYLGKELRL